MLLQLPHPLLTAHVQMYRTVVDSFKDAAGLPEDAVLDVRGNHDSFDVPLMWFATALHEQLLFTFILM